jgi:N-acetyl-gamma-glutamyl-phosphate reductase
VIVHGLPLSCAADFAWSSGDDVQVFVDGQEGTTGLRIHEYLAARSDIEVLKIDADKRKDPAERARLLNAADVAFLCLPTPPREAAAMITNPNTCLIDASTAHRTVPGWTFGLPELAQGQRDAIRASKRIANPGCHASAFILAVRRWWTPACCRATRRSAPPPSPAIRAAARA